MEKADGYPHHASLIKIPLEIIQIIQI